MSTRQPAHGKEDGSRTMKERAINGKESGDDINKQQTKLPGKVEELAGKRINVFGRIIRLLR